MNNSDPPNSPFDTLPVEHEIGSERSVPALSRSVQVQLGQRLRHFYESLALGETPVPERFIELINRLDQMTAEEKPS